MIKNFVLAGFAALSFFAGNAHASATVYTFSGTHFYVDEIAGIDGYAPAVDSAMSGSLTYEAAAAPTATLSDGSLRYDLPASARLVINSNGRLFTSDSVWVNTDVIGLDSSGAQLIDTLGIVGTNVTMDGVAINGFLALVLSGDSIALSGTALPSSFTSEQFGFSQAGAIGLGEVESIFSDEAPPVYTAFELTSLAPVPEPQTWGLSLLGLAAIALARRTRRQA